MKEIILIISYVLIGGINGGAFIFADWSDEPSIVRILAAVMAVIEIIVVRWFINFIFGKV